MRNNQTMLAELADHNVEKLGVQEGDITEIGNLRLTWKARGEQTGFQFGIYETELTPGSGVPLHKHPFAEVFYVLDGSLSFARVNPDGTMDWLKCGAGECIKVPANAPHGMQNQTERPAKVLSVSTYQHELILTQGGRFVQKDDPAPAEPSSEALQRFTEVARQHQGYWVELDT